MAATTEPVADEITAEDIKHIFHSKTFWFNLAAALFALLADNIALLRDTFNDSAYLTIMLAVSAFNIYLRTVTTSKVRLK